MKKKVYAKPTLIGEEFVPNEYVAACENPTSYVGYCDISGDVYLDTNENQQFDPKIDIYKYRNTACNEKYESTTKPHINAFVVSKYWNWSKRHWEYNAIPVFNYNNVHVTQHIDETLHHNVS
ncbi:hypothetical protein BSEG_00356 [Phocaeicola dorei 5_1_36/D4]|uniref:hypothetical protein n=1 Tax=Phocaeicola dorei TaxID=357276 RepID=UPI0001A25001|nr:hypothetical protein [Phocaeicola dorei]EEO44215.1 hypothetical protein BSEG_00356 [Phocaeicola dorei 5_1_36/D4]